MKLLKKLFIGCLAVAFSTGSFHMGEICVSATSPEKPESEAEKFIINIRTARKCLERQLQPELSNLEKIMIDSVKNLKKSRIETAAAKLSKLSSEVRKTSNPSFAPFDQIKQKLEQVRKDKLGRLFLKKLLTIHKVFKEEIIKKQSLADLITIECTCPPNSLIIKTSKESVYNYLFTHKQFGIPTEDFFGMSNLRKIINSLFKDYDILTIIFPDRIIHLTDISKDLNKCKVIYKGALRIWTMDYLESLCRNSKVLDVYYMEKLKK